MIEVEFPDGRIVEFPTGTPEAVIKQAVTDFLFPPAPTPASEPDASWPPPMPPASPIVPGARRFRLGPFEHDEALPGMVPTMTNRERMERLQAERINARIGQPPENDPFRDNWRPPHWYGQR